MSPPAIENNNCQTNASAPNLYIEEHHGNEINHRDDPNDDTVELVDQMLSPHYPTPTLLSILNGNIASNAVIPRARMTTSSAGPIYELPEELRPLHFRSEEEQKKHLTDLIDQALAVIEAGPGEDFLAAPSGADLFTTELAQ